MKGKLYKQEHGLWTVRYLIDWNTDTYKSIPLHPDDIQQIQEESKVFDNIEARIAAYPDVDFEYVSGYAKIIREKEYAEEETVEYPELEGTLALTNELIFKREIFNWLKTRFTEDAPISYVIREYQKKFLNER